MKSIVISIHIPKTGGTTLKNILTSVYGDSFLWLTQTNSPRVAFEKLRGYDLEKIKCIHGHIGYGIHNYLSFMGIDCKYITFTRPIEDRLLSYFNYINTAAVDEYYKWDQRFGWYKDITFYDWLLSCKMADQDNSIVRFLSGCDNLNTEEVRYKMSKQDFELANKNMNSFLFVGSQSNFSSDIEVLANLLSWDSIPNYGADNANPDHRHVQDLDEKESTLLKESQRLDYKLLKIISKTLMTI